MASAGATGPGGPTPRPNLPYHLQHVVGQRCHVTLAVHFPQSAQSGFLSSQPVQRSESPFGDGLTPDTLPPVCSGPVPLSGSRILGVIYGYPEVTPFLSWREASVLDGASLTILLTRHIEVGPLPLVVRTPTQDFALRANQVVKGGEKMYRAGGPIAWFGRRKTVRPVVFHSAGFLPGMDGNVRGDGLFLQQMPEPTVAVAGVSS